VPSEANAEADAAGLSAWVVTAFVIGRLVTVVFGPASGTCGGGIRLAWVYRSDSETATGRASKVAAGATGAAGSTDAAPAV
jgi:hypothetical protein